MSETILNLALVILPSVYLGVLLGRRSPGSSLLEAKKEVEEKLREEHKLQQRETAVTMHSEMAKIRNSIVESAQAYQEIVKTIDKEIAPWQDVAALVDDSDAGALPLVIGVAEPIEEDVSTEEESDFLDEKAAES